MTFWLEMFAALEAVIAKTSTYPGRDFAGRAPARPKWWDPAPAPGPGPARLPGAGALPFFLPDKCRKGLLFKQIRLRFKAKRSPF